MSNAQNPFASMFEMQRRTLQQGQRTLEESMRTQRQLTDAFLDTMDSQKETQKKGVGVMKSATDAYIDAMASMTPGDEAAVEDAHAAVDDQFEAFDEVHSQLWEAFERNARESADAYESVSERYLALVNDSFDVMVETNRQWEDQSVAAAEAVEEEME
jgi:hypothetical protein